MRDADERLLRGMGRLLHDGSAGAVDPAAEAAGSARLAKALASGAKPKAERRAAARIRWSLASAAVLLALCVVYVAWPADVLDYTVQGAPLSEGGYVAPSTPQGAAIRFSDGSEVQVDAGSSLRVSNVTSSGARLQLEHGTIDVSVIHANGAAWFIDAGPYEIEVTGTRFSAAWSRSDLVFRTVLREGAVMVRGPLTPDGVRVEAGQELVANEREGEMRLNRIGPNPPEVPLDRTADAPVEAVTPGEGGDETDGASPAPAGSGSADASAVGEPPPNRSWSKRVGEGDFEAVFAEAEARGIAGVLSSGSGADVAALSDAARYVGRGDVHHQALLAQRKRFPKSLGARNAAFLLGRMVHDGGSASGAIAWYDRYLSESPGGTFSAEALGRKMVAVRSVRGAAAAQPLAQAYLKSYPKGGFANVARDILKR